MDEDDCVLGVRREKLSKKPCDIINCFSDVPETLLHGGLIGRNVTVKMSDLKSHIYLGWNTLPSKAVLPGHWHDLEEIWVILDGEALWLDCDGSKKNVKKGDFIHVTPNGFHEIRNTGDKPLHYILIKSPIPQIVKPYTLEFFEPIEKYTARAKPIGEVIPDIKKS